MTASVDRAVSPETRVMGQLLRVQRAMGLLPRVQGWWSCESKGRNLEPQVLKLKAIPERETRRIPSKWDGFQFWIYWVWGHPMAIQWKAYTKPLDLSLWNSGVRSELNLSNGGDVMLVNGTWRDEDHCFVISRIKITRMEKSLGEKCQLRTGLLWESLEHCKML